ncbi:cleft lip and palate family of eukaryotic membrane s (potential transporters) with 9 transmembrane domains [Cryptosporidium sp. chipmunk genotype I]|uniref:cleft lip and palate family of eukaryotic membrane s (potential transporters) with 9 transmembrane domains n=1 Tax=Cryptosporidium sp. chipmunk genotype I TaxID=1280935 RepID=UPI00351A1DEE|nr:cleft lip and palate family of eukaryotic membrane s (potential transporters) with 9 transmembrane domains [Cryptosporidium sp. chipmunk genotype I]
MQNSETSGNISVPTEEVRNSWFSGILGTILRVIFFQIVMNYFMGGQRNGVINNTTGELIKPLSNYYKPGSIYDLHAHVIFGNEESISSLKFEYLNKSSVLLEMNNFTNITSAIEVWRIRNLIYDNSDVSLSKNISLNLPPELFKYNIEDTSNVYNDINAFLVVSLIGKERNDFVPINYVDLTKTMNKLSDEDSLVSLLDSNDQKGLINQHDKKVKYWKDNINIRVIYDDQEYNIAQRNVPPVSFMKYNVAESIYLPIIYPSDFWCIERNFKMLNSTTINHPFNLTLTFNTFSLFKYTIQRQMMDTWELQSRYGLGQSQKDIMMIKRILIETNKYYLIFSLVFFILHSSFQMLAFKNDISFWNKNDSMYGLSGLSILASFISELVIGLYLFDSNETSWILLIEIFIGIAISAWKLWKTKIFILSKRFPFVSIKDDSDIYLDHSDEESKAKLEQEKLSRHYDLIAIKYMSILLAPCIVGYAMYSLKHYKYKSWYSFIISTLAGTVYTFGFIMMTPQLYINYKLKSVDHLPWRFLVYKALNTFIDDVFSFIIDMPWMHRMACFRDDIIFIIYLYQRWIYRSKKNQQSDIKSVDTSIIDSNGAKDSDSSSFPNDKPENSNEKSKIE